MEYIYQILYRSITFQCIEECTFRFCKRDYSHKDRFCFELSKYYFQGIDYTSREPSNSFLYTYKHLTH